MTVWWNALTDLQRIFAVFAIPSTLLLLLQTLLLLFGLVGHGDAEMSHDHDISHDGHDFSHDGHDFSHDGHDFSHDGHAGFSSDTEHAGDFHADAANAADGHMHDTLQEHYTGHAHMDHHGIFDNGLRIFTVRGFVAFFSIFGWSGIVLLKSGMRAPGAVFLSILFGFLSMVAIAVIFALFMKLQSDGTVSMDSAIGATATVYIAIPPGRTGFGKINVTVNGQLRECNAVTDVNTKINTNKPVTIVALSGNNTFVVVPAK